MILFSSSDFGKLINTMVFCCLDNMLVYIESSAVRARAPASTPAAADSDIRRQVPWAKLLGDILRRRISFLTPVAHAFPRSQNQTIHHRWSDFNIR